MNYIKNFHFVMAVIIIILLSQHCNLKKNFTLNPDKLKNLTFYKIRFNFRTENNVQRGKILCKTDSDNLGSLTFLTPLNQIIFQIFIVHDKAILICRKRGKYWSGTFKEITTKLWGLDLKYTDFLNIIKYNKIPSYQHLKQKLTINIIKNSFPKQIKISTIRTNLELRIIQKEIRNDFNFNYNLDGLKISSLENILEKN